MLPARPPALILQQSDTIIVAAKDGNICTTRTPIESTTTLKSPTLTTPLAPFNLINDSISADTPFECEMSDDDDPHRSYSDIIPDYLSTLTKHGMSLLSPIQSLCL